MKKGYWPSIAPPHDRYVLLARLLPEVARAGMVVSPDRLIRLQRLLETLSPDLPIQELGPWLSPLFATNDLQQDCFARAMDAILQSLAEAAPKVPPKAEVDQPTGTKATDRPLPQMPEAEREAEKPAERSAAYTVDIEQCTEPPYVWRIAADEDVLIAEGSEHGRTLAWLRSREASDLRFLDWPTTLRATIAQAGMPALRYRARTRTVEYLLLVERFSADDHRALLFDHLYQNLRSQDVLIERYFHDGDPRHCYNERHPNGISLRELHYRHVHARLLYMGNGYRLLDHETGQPADWAKNTLLGWNTRMLLTPLARHGWGLREFQLKSLFILLPAAWEALRYAAEYPQPDQALRYTELPDYVRAAAEWPQAPIDAPYLPYLRAQLPKPLLLWTAACAVWPALHFNLTLQLGRLLSDDTYNLLQYHHLARLAALPWFANGFIPKDVRRELLEYLDTEHPDTLRRCADYLLQLLQQQFPDNPRSHAAAEHTLYVAMLQTLAASQPDEASLSRLRTVLKRLRRPAQITDFVLPRRWGAMLDETGFGEEVVPPPQPDSESPLRAGMIFAEQYRLEALIGKGGFGQVWRALRIEPGMESAYSETIATEEALTAEDAGQVLAIKIFTGGERYYDYCVQEFKHSNLLEHPRLIRLYDCGMWNGFPWQTMPLYRPLSAGEWEESDLWRLLHDMASALAYLHARKPPITHNDIQPGQFLQNEDGDYLLADLGISGELLQVAARDIRPTVYPEFLPPECSSDLYHRSLATDVYALGASLYYLAAGRPSVSGRSSMASQSAAPTNPAPLPTQFSGDLNSLLMECLSHAPAERPNAERILQIAGDWLAERGLIIPKHIKEMENVIEEVKAQKNAAVKNQQYEKAADLRDKESKMARQLEFAKIQWEEKVKAKDYIVAKEKTQGHIKNTQFPRHIKEMEKAIEEVKAQKNTAMKNQQWAKAADLRDKETKMARQLEFAKKEWEEHVRADDFTFTEENVAAAPDNIDMVFIPGGAFDMGDVMGDNEQNDETVHRVTVADFYIGRTEVTFAEYDVFCDATRREKPSDSGWGRSNRPVINVSWYDAVEYCNWLSAQHGLTLYYTIDKTRKAPNNTSNSDDLKWTVTPNRSANGYRLPTEAEWEYAAREGGKKVRFGNGKDIIDPKEVNFDASEGYKKPYSVVGEYIKKTVPVGSLNSPNALELHDMSGNVWEWCWDWYGSYPAGAQNNPMGAGKGSHRVLRGGSWLDDPLACRAATRADYSPMNRGDDLGFRLARS